MDIFEIIWDLFFWCIGIFCLCVAYGIGMLVYNVFQKVLEGIGEGLGLSYFSGFWPFLDIVFRLIVLIVAVVVMFTGHIPIGDVLHSFSGLGSFDEVMSLLAANQEDMYILNNIVYVAWYELLMTFLYFLPYFIITEVIGIVKKLICGPRSDGIYGFISYIPELLTLLACNVFVLYMGNGLAYIMIEFLDSVKLRYGLFRMLWRMVLFCVYMYRVVCDMFGSDLFLSMMGANIAALMLNVSLTGKMRTTVLILSIVVGYVSKAVRALIGLFLGVEHDLIHTIYGVVSLAALSGIFVLILKIRGC